jgi:hypothetical protein
MDLVLEPGWDNNYEEFEERRAALENLKSLIRSYQATLHIPSTFFPVVQIVLTRTSSNSYGIRAVAELLTLGKVDFGVDSAHIFEVANAILETANSRDIHYSLQLHEAMLIPYALSISADALIIANQELAETLVRLSNDSTDIRFDIPIIDPLESLELLSRNQPYSSSLREEIYPRTPRGRVIRLRRGATVIDFAYAIHTDVGNNCLTAFVNEEEQSLDTKLKTNDVVEIIQAERPYPEASWLRFAKTRRAKDAIKRSVRVYRRNKGWEIIRSHFDLRNTRKKLEVVAHTMRLKSLNRLVEKVGDGSISVDNLSERLRVVTMDQLGDAIQINSAKSDKYFSLSDSLPNLRLSKCCFPFPSDETIGIIGINDNVVRVHRRECPNIQNINPDSFAEVFWNCSSCYLELYLMMKDSPDTLRNILNTLAEQQMPPDIRNVYTSRGDGKASATIAVPLQSREVMRKLVSFIGKMPNVLQVKIKKIYPAAIES